MISGMLRTGVIMKWSFRDLRGLKDHEINARYYVYNSYSTAISLLIKSNKFDQTEAKKVTFTNNEAEAFKTINA